MFKLYECHDSDLCSTKRSDYTGGPIRLFCCHTGERDENGDCFAQRLADILGVEVKAPPAVTHIRSDGTFYFGKRGEETEEFNVFSPHIKGQT